MSRAGTPVIKTYRYLRIALVGIVVALTISVVIETLRDELRRSISEYYYTPARAIFVGALIAIGVCLIALRGNTDLEDILLNLAGLCAPVVALVPTPLAAQADDQAIRLAVLNNTSALLITAGLGVLIAFGLAAAEARRTSWRAADLAGLVLATSAIVGCALWLGFATDNFLRWGHYTAAALMFACIALVMASNTRAGERVLSSLLRRMRRDDQMVQRRTGEHSRFSRVYGALAVLMLVTQLSWLFYSHWEFTVLFVEAVMITLFAIFWSLQTYDLRGTELPADQPTAA